MFEVRFPKSNSIRFKRILMTLGRLMKNVHFQCYSKGISVSMMDSNSVILSVMFLNADHFEYYNCPENTSLYFNIKEALDTLTKTIYKETISLVKKDTYSAQMEIITRCDESKKIKSFPVQLLYPEYTKTVKAADIVYQSIFSMDSIQFHKKIANLCAIGDRLMIGCEAKTVSLGIHNDDLDITGLVILHADINGDEKKEDKNNLEIEHNDSTSGLFSLYYLHILSSAHELSKSITINSANKMPILIEFVMPNMGYLGFHLAPIVPE
jgi:proliferating cell nuclear antigen